MIEDNIKHPVIAQIPLDEAGVLNSINRGVPFMVDAKTKPVALAVQQLADRIVAEFQRPASDLVGAEESSRKKSSLFRS
jgi:MinD-like ATPase involved in chromosome partitioning or flagellar assembly